MMSGPRTPRPGLPASEAGDDNVEDTGDAVDDSH